MIPTNVISCCRYSDLVVNKLLLTATTLDPRFKSLPTMVDETKATLEGAVKEELKILVEQTPVENKYIVEDSPVKKKSKLSGRYTHLVTLLAQLKHVLF